MSTFSLRLQRIGWLIRLQVAEHWKNSLRYFLGIQVAFVITVMLFIYNAFNTISGYGISHSDSQYVLNHVTEGMSGVGAFALVCSFVFSASAVLSLKTDRGKRAAQLLLPAQTSEYIFVRWLLFNLGGVVLTFVALCIADVVGYCIIQSYGYDYSWFIPDALSHVATIFQFTPINANKFHTMLGDWSTAMLPLLSVLITWSFYLWGGAFFRKKSFIMTSLICFIIFVAMTTIAISVLADPLNEMIKGTEQETIIYHKMDVLYTIYWLGGVAWFCANLFFGYRLRKKASLMPRHWYGQ